MHSLVHCYFAWYYTQVQQIITQKELMHEHENKGLPPSSILIDMSF